jgi:hypothetical protein
LLYFQLLFWTISLSLCRAILIADGIELSTRIQARLFNQN